MHLGIDEHLCTFVFHIVKVKIFYDVRFILMLRMSFYFLLLVFLNSLNIFVLMFDYYNIISFFWEAR